MIPYLVKIFTWFMEIVLLIRISEIKEQATNLKKCDTEESLNMLKSNSKDGHFQSG